MNVTTRQLIFMVAAISVFSAGLAWWLQRFELTDLHAEVRDYLRKQDRFKQWEAEQDSA